MGNPVLPDDILREVPGNVRKAKQFVRFLEVGRARGECDRAVL